MTISISNTAVALVTPSSDWSSTPTHCVLWVGATALDQAALAWTGGVPGAAPGNGQGITFAAGDLVFTLTNTDYNEAGLLAILQAGADEVVFTLSLHDGAPGANYSSNEIAAASNPGYARLDVTVAIA